MPLKVIFFDLDDTILDTSTLLVPIAKTPAFESRIREPLPLMEGALENLKALQKKYTLFLVTQGRLDAQKQKVASLGIQSFFKEMHFADPTREEKKSDLFQKIISQHQLHSKEFLAIGNRIATDLREVKRQGGLTCHFYYGEHKDDPKEGPHDEPDYQILHHRDLITKCKL